MKLFAFVRTLGRKIFNRDEKSAEKVQQRLRCWLLN